MIIASRSHRSRHAGAPALCALAAATLLAGGALAAGSARAQTTAQAMPETMDMLRHAIAFQTVVGKDQVPAFAHYLAGKLESAGLPASDIQIIPFGHTAALVARYRGSGEGKPILLSAHMDVVAATNPKAWKSPPFKLTRDGKYLYGRGVADMKSNVVALVETFMRLKREGYVPDRDLILVFSGDEEIPSVTTPALAKRFHDAAFVLNGDAGGGVYDSRFKPVLFRVQTAEKTYANFVFTATSPGGHSSEPTGNNAIYHLTKALGRLSAYQFPVRYNAMTRAALAADGEHQTGAFGAALRAFAANPRDAQAAATLSRNPAYVGQIRTTCVPTTIKGGDAWNALPKHVSANVNCRIFPGIKPAQVKAQIAGVVNDAAIQVSVRQPAPHASPISPLKPRLMHAITAAVHARFPHVKIVPSMSAGATDSKYFRLAGVPSYGVNPEFAVPDSTHAHGVNERLLASEIPAALTYWHTLLTKLTQK